VGLPGRVPGESPWTPRATQRVGPKGDACARSPIASSSSSATGGELVTHGWARDFMRVGVLSNTGGKTTL
jgi:hypothetical protein